MFAFSSVQLLLKKSNKVYGLEEFTEKQSSPLCYQHRVETKAATPIQETSEALRASRFGRFHLQLLLTSFTGIMTGVASSNTTSYLLPSAECDLNMNLVQKGILTAVPYFGMMFSTVLAGFLCDTFGRKIFIIAGYGGIFLLTIIAGTSQTYGVLVSMKFLEGVLFATAFSSMISLTSEFCSNEVRDRVMIVQSSFMSFAQIVIPAQTLAILPNDWHAEFFNGAIVLRTWNFYLYIMSMWSLLATLLYLQIPESPKFLVMQERYHEAREILISIYVRNTGKPAETYPFYDLWKNKTQQVINESPEERGRCSLAHQLSIGLHNLKPMWQKPRVLYLALFCIINLFVMWLYNVFRLWYPQLSTIVEHYTHDSDSKDFCQMLDAYTADLNTQNLQIVNNTIDLLNVTETCVPKKSGIETYINSMVVGCVGMLPYLLNSILVTYVGKKPLIIGSSLLCSCACLALRWAASRISIVILFAMNIALSQTLLSLVQAVAIQQFPTTTRAMAISLIMMSGRVGTLVGNVTFPVLLNLGCVVPFSVFTCMLFSITLMSVLVPNDKKQ